MGAVLAIVLEYGPKLIAAGVDGIALWNKTKETLKQTGRLSPEDSAKLDAVVASEDTDPDFQQDQ